MSADVETEKPGGFANARDVAEIDRWGTSREFGLRLGVLYRSEAPLADDPAPFESWPPELVIDLRSPTEHAGPHPMAGESQVVQLPFYDRGDPRTLATHGTSLPDLYRLMLDAAVPQLLRIVDLVASSSGPVLLHCAAGKDRTGIAVGVLLSAVGVPDDLVLSDYIRTNDNMPALLARMAAAQPPGEREAFRAALAAVPAGLLSASSPALARVLAAVAGGPGGAADWLLSHGLDPALLLELRNRLVMDVA